MITLVKTVRLGTGLTSEDVAALATMARTHGEGARYAAVNSMLKGDQRDAAEMLMLTDLGNSLHAPVRRVI